MNMNTEKIDLTLPKPLLVIIDDFIRHRGVSRSTFISEAIREKIIKEKDMWIKETYDTVFSDESVCKEQLETLAWFESCGNDEGQEW